MQFVVKVQLYVWIFLGLCGSEMSQTYISQIQTWHKHQKMIHMIHVKCSKNTAWQHAVESVPHWSGMTSCRLPWISSAMQYSSQWIQVCENWCSGTIWSLSISLFIPADWFGTEFQSSLHFRKNPVDLHDGNAQSICSGLRFRLVSKQPYTGRSVGRNGLSFHLELWAKLQYVIISET